MQARRQAQNEAAVLPLPLQFLAAWIGTWVCRAQAAQIEYLAEQNRILMARVGKRALRLSDGERRRLAVLAKEVGRKALAGVSTIATPDTVLRWYRELVAKKYDGSAKHGPGRTRTDAKIVTLILQMARENPGWGYTRIKSAPGNLGYKVGRNTIKRTLREHGIEPAPARKKRHSWATFIKAHSDAIVAMDFFTVEVLALTGLVRYHVLFVIDLGSRIVEIAGIARDPDGAWMKQVARNLLDAEDGFLLGKRYLIMDRDPVYTKEFRSMLKAKGVKPRPIPPRSPNLNAFAERFVLSIRSECLDRIVPLGEAHLRRAVTEFMAHYHAERNHQGLANRLIKGAPTPANTNGSIQKRERLGGLLNFYHRQAA